MHLLGGIGLTEEEDLAGELFLSDLLGQIRAAIATVEAADVASVCLNRACSRLASVRSQVTCRLWPPPAAQPLTRQITTFGMNRMSRCTSMMCNRPARAASTVSAVSPLRVLVSAASADALIATRAERPPAVLR